MKKKPLIPMVIMLVAAVLLGQAGCSRSTSQAGTTRLRCESLVDPLGMDLPQPRLSWEVTGGGRGTAQTAYRLLVASSPEKLARGEADLWDSGKVASDRSFGIPYAGVPLKSGARCHWQVKVWDQEDLESAWSEPALWSVGLLDAGDWKARWIGLDSAFAADRPTAERTRLAARHLRKEFTARSAVRRATIHICGLGLYELYLNGKRVGDQVLAPGPTEYDKRVFYNTYDVTDHIRRGVNAIGVLLGNGRFFTMRGTPMRWNNQFMPVAMSYGFPKLLFQLELSYEDGSSALVGSDATWRITADGPITANNEFDGEEYDARKEMTGWHQPDFDDRNWLPVQMVKEPGRKIEAQRNEAIKVVETLNPVSVREHKPGLFIYDMGQNMVGWVRLRVSGKAGQQVKLRFAEILAPDSSLYVENLRSARATDLYTLRGGAPETWEPRFTYHGFRYVEVSGYPGTPGLETLLGRVVHDDLTRTGRFATSDPVINQVYENACWGIRGNYRGMPTDCPQRDERMAWLGDRAAVCTGEGFIFDQHNFYVKWLQDIEDAQNPEGSIPDVAPAYWKLHTGSITYPGVYLLVAEMLYRQYGDEQPIRRHYPSMKKWMAYVRAKSMKNDLVATGSYGDWCVPPERIEMVLSKDPARQTSGNYMDNVFYYRMLQLMGQFAGLLGKQDEAVAWRAEENRMKAAINTAFYKADSSHYANNTVTANLFSLVYGLAPQQARAAIFKNIVRKIEANDHLISTGNAGTQWLMRTLSDYGRPDMAYRLATNTAYPSWGYMAKSGATTIWELWNGNTAEPTMNSGNHVMMLGDLITWYYEYLAGIRPDSTMPGFKRIVLKPIVPPGLSFVKASYHSAHGLIISEWQRSQGTFQWQATIPANTAALIYVPSASGTDVREGDGPAGRAEGLRLLRREGGYTVFEAQSGSYAFRSAL